MAVQARGRGGKIAARVPAPVLAPWGAGLVSHSRIGPSTACHWCWPTPMAAAMARQPPRNGPRQRSRHSTHEITAPGADQPGAAVLTPEQRTATAGPFLPLPPQHTQRRQFLGALDAAWVGYQQAPYFPAGTDLRWLTVARGRCHSTYWRGNKPWEVVGMHPGPDPGQRAFAGFAPGLFVQYADPAVAASGTAGIRPGCRAVPPDRTGGVALPHALGGAERLDGADIDTVALGIERADEPSLGATSFARAAAAQRGRSLEPQRPPRWLGWPQQRPVLLARPRHRDRRSWPPVCKRPVTPCMTRWRRPTPMVWRSPSAWQTAWGLLPLTPRRIPSTQHQLRGASGGPSAAQPATGCGGHAGRH